MTEGEVDTRSILLGTSLLEEIVTSGGLSGSHLGLVRD